ncbi:uncharacterized protein LOC123908206 [Trifolium pratense]|uniref:Uncharacterized protein n=2 Tax=Trifolium pratense TaxID=57577 RepID=A0ACB0LMI3_TRIPR|nr:uncharacterized protein LOC123908206 [Trifolium pratense]CAJ2668342.1 unnamed protein product [Trifolium pratense]
MVLTIAKPNLLSCNFPTLKTKNSTQPHKTTFTTKCCFRQLNSSFKPVLNKPQFPASFRRKSSIIICKDSNKDSEVSSNNVEEEGKRDWTTSILLFLLWAALIYYVSFLSPNQTPSRDMYFLKKLLNLKGDDGFRMNEVLVAEWYIMGLWPLVYSMLLLPTGRSSKSSVPVWPFLSLSCFGGIYALLPYFVLWKPPPPPVEEAELKTWPLNFLESKVTASILLASGIGLIIYAGLAGEDVWKEFYQYCRESKFIHLTSIDFTLLSTLAPFWVYNDMTARKWFDKGSWLLPVSLIPLLGPSLYILLRPALSTSVIAQTPVESE